VVIANGLTEDVLLRVCPTVKRWARHFHSSVNKLEGRKRRLLSGSRSKAEIHHR